MTATASKQTEVRTSRRASTEGNDWVRLLAWTAGLVAAVDIIFFMLIAALIPPLAVGAVLTIVGLLLLRANKQRWGVGVLGVTSLLLLLASAPFAVDHLAHPESGIDWVHAVVAVFGRVLAIAIVVPAWRRASDTAVRRVRLASLGALAGILVIAAVATFATTGETAEAGDVIAPVEEAAFPTEIVVDRGGVVFVDNVDMFRHTFTVEGTGIDAELPALQGVRVPIDLAPGSYELICAVPGHEFMTGTLTVR